MIEYDFTHTRLFKASHVESPTDAELFVITAALLLARGHTYSAIYDEELVLTADDIDSVARPFETTLNAFASEFRGKGTIRDRLAKFVGLRIAGIKPERRS